MSVRAVVVVLMLLLAEQGWALRALSTVTARNVRWLVHGLIPLRTLTLVAGVGGLGKSTWLFARAADLSRQGDRSTVVVSSRTRPPRSSGRASMQPEATATSSTRCTRKGDGLDTVQLPSDALELQRLVRSVGAKLIIIDPIVAAIETSLDAHKDQHVRHVLGWLARLAVEEDAAVVLVGHLNKESVDGGVHPGRELDRVLERLPQRRADHG